MNSHFYVFGNLTVAKHVYDSATVKHPVLCLCTCGKVTTKLKGNIKCGATKSCGCMQHPVTESPVSSHPLYATWNVMIQRCHLETSSAYRYYGKRGIKVCSRWRNSFAAFVEDMGKKPSPSHSLERINNNGNYEPLNCRWATRAEQAQNRRFVLNASGVTLTASGKWSARLPSINGIRKYLGSFPTQELAIEAIKNYKS